MKIILSLILSLNLARVYAQTMSDTTKLPFAIAGEKRLSDEDLKNKKEGVYMTGVPDISSDPVNGFGFGAEGQLFLNGKRSDPFFAYTAYRAELSFSIFYTIRSEHEFKFQWDMPYIADTKWRLRGQLVYSVDPNLLFFGITEQSLKPLNYYPNNDTTKTQVTNASYGNYENNLVGSKNDYNTFQQEEKVFNLSMEHEWFSGKMRTLFGYELGGDNISTPLNDSSLVHQEAVSGMINGFGKNHVALVQVGVIYDTRDLEPDPSSGSFAEITNETSLKVLGSQYNFNRTFIHYNLYHKVFKNTFKKFVIAARVGLGYTTSGAPFYEYLDQYTSEGDIEGLGGDKTLRGFKQSRFASNAMELTNVEFRLRFLQLHFLKQYLTFNIVPFFDAGGVWDSLDRISHLENLRYSEGLGLRIGWNENTILRFDYSVSKEDHQFFFEIGHIF